MGADVLLVSALAGSTLLCKTRAQLLQQPEPRPLLPLGLAPHSRPRVAGDGG